MPEWLDNIYITSPQGNSSLVTTLETYFRSYGIRINKNPDSAKYWLVIEHAERQQNINSIGSGSNPRQYQLIYTVSYLLQTAKGKIVKPLNTLSVTRQLTVNNDRILGSNDEAEQLVSEMQADAAAQIINRLSR